VPDEVSRHSDTNKPVAATNFNTFDGLIGLPKACDVQMKST